MTRDPYPNYKIIQIIPAPGWKALYDRENFIKEEPLVCWALVDFSEVREVIGLVASVNEMMPADGIDYFLRYDHAPNAD